MRRTDSSLLLLSLALAEQSLGFQTSFYRLRQRLGVTHNPIDVADLKIGTGISELYGPPKAPSPKVEYMPVPPIQRVLEASSPRPVKKNGATVVTSAANGNNGVKQQTKNGIEIPKITTNAQQSSSSMALRRLQKIAQDNAPKTKAFTDNKWVATSASGLFVALLMIPEVLAYSFVAGVSPLVGLWTTVCMGLTATAVGGRPAGVCSSASAACAVIVASLSAAQGPAYVSACAVLAGLFQVAFGKLGLAQLARLIPHPVMLGFVNGLALLLAKSQWTHFRGLTPLSASGIATYFVTALTMIVTKFMPPAISRVIPTSLGAIGLVTLLSNALKLPVATLKDVAGASTFAGGLSALPKLGLPAVPLTLQTIKVILPYAAAIAMVGCMQSVFTQNIVNGMVTDKKAQQGTSLDQVCVGQGAGNVVSGLFGGIPGSAVLAPSIANVQMGGAISRWSSASMALFLAAGIVGALPLLRTVPAASLAGVMLMVCQSTFSWSSLRVLKKIPKMDALVVALTSLVTFKYNLAAGLVSGTVASALGFAWKQSMGLKVTTKMFEDRSNAVNGDAGVITKEYKLKGPLFFGSTKLFFSVFEPKQDPNTVILDMEDSHIADHSALEAIRNVADSYASFGKKLVLRNLSPECKELLENYYQDVPTTFLVENDYHMDPAADMVQNGAGSETELVR